MRTLFPTYACQIYVRELRASFGLRIFLPSHPSRLASYPLPVRQASVLPRASFRFHLTADTLALQLAVPLAGSAWDFNPLESAPCRAHEKTGNGFKPLPVGECNCNSRTP